jgi:hypothetical protein
MLKSHVMLVGGLLLHMAMVLGCSSGFMDSASTFSVGSSKHLRGQMLLYREEAAELRAAAQYYREESQRSAEESSQESERTRRYRDFAQQAWAQAEEADRHAEEYQGQLL